jgi:ADP-ribose pyrophosphatase YjhB (NUDIX family)
MTQQRIVPAVPGESMPQHSGGQDWIVSWHEPAAEPAGKPHGAAGVCVAGDRLVLIGPDGVHWGFPAGRPEGDETVEQTLRRELAEEACVDVTAERLLGYARSQCVAGREAGLVLVRSYWRADVTVLPWEPRFEIKHRKVIAVADAWSLVRDPDEVATRLSHRALAEAGID